jgi:uncharacterized membrane protein
MPWLILAITVAVLTSVQDVLNKNLLARQNVYLVTWAWWAFSLPVLYLCLPFIKIPEVNNQFWVALSVDTVLLVVASVYYVKALEASDLSLAVPMLSFTPLFLLVSSPWLLGEHPHSSGIFGVLVIVIGSYLLFCRDCQKNIWAPFKSLMNHQGTRYMLIVAFIFSIGGNLDKIGVQNSSAFFWVLALNTTLSLSLTILLFLKVKDIVPQISKEFKILSLVGIVNGACLILQMMAITQTQVPYLIAVKRTSIVISAVYGWIVLKEKLDAPRFAGVILMVLGVLIFSFLR